MREAERMGLMDPVVEELRKLCSLGPELYIDVLRITGHPLSELLSQFFAYSFGNGLNEIAKWFDLPTHEAPRFP